MECDDEDVCVPKNFKIIENTHTSSLVNFESRFNADSRSSTNDSECLLDLNNNYSSNNKNVQTTHSIKIIYCICKSSDIQQFMIACDHCNEWYHGDCIGVKQYLASKIIKFYCHLCRFVNKSLKIEFESKYEDKLLQPNHANIRFHQQNNFREAIEEELIKSNKIKTIFENFPSGKLLDPNDQKTKNAVDKAKPTGEQHCLGPNCSNTCLKNSKYCSNKCGLELAKQRVYKLIPERIYQYNATISYAEIYYLNAIERIQTQTIDLNKKLAQLNEERNVLLKYIKKRKIGKIDLTIEKKRENNYADINCFTCGFIINEKTALRHMEKCYLKLEMKSYFGTTSKQTGELQSILCNNFNPVTELYCRHLKIICPEHSKKDMKLNDEFCACPLNSKENIFEYTNEFCKASKRECSLHFNWDKLRLANLDIQKLNIIIKLNQLEKEKKSNEDSLIQRGNFLSLLLHQTKK